MCGYLVITPCLQLSMTIIKDAIEVSYDEDGWEIMTHVKQLESCLVHSTYSISNFTSMCQVPNTRSNHGKSLYSRINS